MSAKPNYFRIGLFIVVGVALLAAALITFGAGQFFRPRIYIETYVDGTVQGVDVGTPVKFRGVQIGKVSDINFTFNEYGAPGQVDRYNYVIILMEIQKEMFPGMFKENLTSLLEKNIKQGLRARIEPLGITGSNYIEINYVTDPAQFPPLDVDWKPHYYYIPSAPGQLTNILDSMNNIMRQVEQLNLSGMSKSITDVLDNLNKAITDAQISKLSSDLQQLISQLKGAIDSANIGPLSDDARKLMATLNKSSDDLQKILKNIEPASRLNAEQLRSIVRNLDEATANITQFSAEVKSKPSLLLWGTPKATPSPAPRRSR